MRITNRERRDWTLIIFIIPIGIILMMIAGQIAVRIAPLWSVNAGMKSALDLQTVPKQQVGLIQPVLPEIFTPIGWLDTFLTPNANSGNQNVSFPPFIVFKPTATPSPTSIPSTSPTVTETPTATASPSPSPSASPTTVTTVPSATKTKKPPKDTATPPTATPTIPPITSTIDPSLTPVAPPVDINIGAPDGTPGGIQPGYYTVVNISGNPVVVTNPSETNYDMVYYEFDNGGDVYMDNVSVGISQLADGSIYYQVFNWGDNKRDTNTNVDTNNLPADPVCDGTATAPECDNRIIPTADLHPSPGGSGILIDVDNAPSAPPAGSYNYVVLISPTNGAPDGADVDAIEVTEVPP